MNNRNSVFVGLLALAIGLGGGYLASRGGQPTPAPADGTAQSDASTKRKPLYYRNPMNPSVTSPVPAKDPMGMDYVPVYAGDEANSGPAGTVRIDPVVVQNIGVRTAPVERRALAREVRAVGRIGYDEEHLARLHPKVEGWIDHLRVDKTGERVSKDDILLSIYSPELVSSEEEYLLALKNMKTLATSPFPEIRQGAVDLARSARARLRLFDVPEHQIRELERSGRVHKALHIHSPFDGVVIKVGVREGQYVTPKTELYHIVDLSTVWVYVDVFEDDLPWVRVGDEATIRVAAVPGRTFRGRITYIYPYLEAKTRTVKVRMVFANPDGLLKPNMFADVSIQTGRRRHAIVVPSEAIVRSGDREQVFVVTAPGRFEPRPVTLGVSSGGLTEVLKGLSAGEHVVTSAQFLIDSESKLNEATAKMLSKGLVEGAGQGKAPGKGMSMPGMSMDGMDRKGMNKGGMTMKQPQDGSMKGMVHRQDASPMTGMGGKAPMTGDGRPSMPGMTGPTPEGQGGRP